MNNQFKLEPGRQIYRNGQPFISIGREGSTPPDETDDAAHVITHLLNLLDQSDAQLAVVGGSEHTLEAFRNPDLVNTTIGRALR